MKRPLSSACAEELKGRIDKVFYSSARFSAGVLETDDGRATFAGGFQAQAGDQVVLQGHWVSHPKYGRQFKADKVSYDLDFSTSGLAQYLEKHPDFKGIGPVKAKIIADTFGGDFEKILTDDPERIARVAKLPLATVHNLQSNWQELAAFNSLNTWLSQFGFTHHQVKTLADTLGQNAVGVLKTNPYMLIDLLPGFGFRRTDQIALKMGVPKQNQDRLRAGILYCISDALNNGDCWVEYQDLIDRANRLLILDGLDSYDVIGRALSALLDAGDLDAWSNSSRLLIARPAILRMEKDLCRWLIRARARNPHFGKLLTHGQPEQLAAEVGPTLNEGQRAAVESALTHSVTVISGGAGSGKAQPLDAKILTPTGWRQMAEIRVGDLVIGSDGTACRVTGVFPQGVREVFRVTMTDGSSTECCDDHLWLTRSQNDRDRKRPGSVKPLHEIRNSLRTSSGAKRNHWIPVVAPVEFANTSLPIDPYLLGLLLGDGCFRSGGVRFTNPDKPIVRALEAALPPQHYVRRQRGSKIDYRVVGDGSTTGNEILNVLRELGLHGKYSFEKHIPSVYKFSSSGHRLILLQGLLDTDGSTFGHTLEFSTSSRRLARDVLFLVRSLGGTASFARRIPFYTYRGERRVGRPSYRLHICLPGFIWPVRLPRKARRYRPRSKYLPRRAIASVESIGHKPVQCISVNARDQLYVTDDFIVTHNTYTLDCIHKAYARCGLSVKLAAPTGKAAKRMEEAIRQPASTIHRLLESDGTSFKRGPDNPLRANVVIVDEASMVDVSLAWHLFSAIDLSRTAVVLVGDHNQLPPVGPGNLLRDVITTDPVPKVILDKVMRQAGALKDSCTAILRGEVCKTSAREGRGIRPWTVFDQFTDPLEAKAFILATYDRVLQQRLGFVPFNQVQLLTPTHKGPLGTRELNVALQKLLQKKMWGLHVPEVKPGRKPPFYLYDKVIQTKNDYDLNVMNGAMGQVAEVASDRSMVVEFDGRRVKYRAATGKLANLQLAYALTIHKAQGSEIPCAIVIIHKAHSYQHHRNLFYTGVTRAQEMAIVVGDRWGINNCASKKQVNSRATFLSFFLSEAPASPAAGELTSSLYGDGQWQT